MTTRSALAVLVGSLAPGILAAGCSSDGGGSGGAATAAAATSGATTSGTSSSGSTTGSPGARQPPQGQWYAGDLHSHSAPYSRDAQRQMGDDPGTCFFLGEQAGLDYMALTDHRTLDQVNDPTYGAQHLTTLDGEEWGGTIHVGMVGLDREVPLVDYSRSASTYNAQVQAAYDDVHRQGGVVIANHPCQPGKVHVWLSHDLDAVEVWNAYWQFPKGFKEAREQDVDDKVDSLGLRAVGEDANPEIREAVRHAGGGSNHQALKFWEANLNRGRKIAAVGGGDRHMAMFPGRPTTYVFAPDDRADSILQGIREGRTWVGSAEGPIVEFRADADGDGTFERIIGDSVPLHRTVTYEVRVRNARGGKLEIVKDGQVHLKYDLLSDDDTFTFTDVASARAWYRADVFEPVRFGVPQGSSFQLLSLAGSFGGQSGTQALASIATPLGFSVSFGTTRIPQIKLPHAYDKILNFDRKHWGYARGAITSVIWAE